MTDQVQSQTGPAPDDTGQVGYVAKAVKTWTGELVDLGGRNTLLYYRDLRQGTLDLGGRSGANEVAVDGLLAGRPIRLSDLFVDPNVVTAARRVRTVKAKATENFEERGLQTLFLAWGMATWTNLRGIATPAAPVLLRQAALTARGGAGEDFDCSLPGEWELNPTLLHLLKTDYQVELDSAELVDLLENAEPPDSVPVFERIAEAGSLIPGFVVSPRIVLGNFSYAKLPMVLDMETATDALVGSELICAIAGHEPSRDAVRGRHPNMTASEPDVMSPKDEYLVLDADASQSYTINAAVGGADLVVDGPPGTGKSQSIANLIATLSARGQRILFVAEKRAAIDAVLDRLNRVGLGDLVLDLHEGAGPKRKLAADLARTLAMAGSLTKPDMTAAQEALVRRRDVLVNRVEAIHASRDPWAVSVYEVQAGLLEIPPTAASALRLRGNALARLTDEAFRQASANLESFVGLGGLTLHTTSPWAGAYTAGTIITSQDAQQALEATTTIATHTLPDATARFGRALAECGLRVPHTVEMWVQALSLLHGVATTLAVFDPAVYDQPLPELAAALAPAAKGSFGRLRARISDHGYRHARKALLTLWRGNKPNSGELHAAVTAATSQAVTWRQIAIDDGGPRLPFDLAGADGAYGQLSAELQMLGAFVAADNLMKTTISELEARVHSLLADTETLGKLPELARLRIALHGAALWPLVGEIAARNLTVDQALYSLKHVWLASILDTVSVTDARIGAFDGRAHLRTVAEFQVSDRHHIDTAAIRVKRAVAENAIRTRDEFPHESEVIETQARLKRKHLPIRQLFQAAPNVLGALKPCWAMSPLVVSQLLPTQKSFDVVIFDEASQVSPADAVGALMRANRAIVAGDPHQLPPTSFFSTSGGGEDDEEAEQEALGAPAGTANMESILDVMGALLPPPRGTRTLSWHYRSKDERLIAFSNAQPELYDWSLTTFPGVAGSDCLSHVLVPFVPGRVGQEDSVSDEVTQVVEIVAGHARTHPHESLGVIAMGIKHANRISEALRRARVDNPSLDEFLNGTDSAEATKEPFFVKNLERVQGDERDAIILSVGYGKTADGRMLYRFGPINNEGGERRLNVAITRARARMIVVSSFCHSDMDPNRLRSAGAQMLGRYLAYAESGGSDLGSVTRDKPELNPFERDVEVQLTRAGVPLVAQYGCSGYSIDYAAQHPTRRGEMVLAIECDGATYHSSETARDRDRLRQEHLERLGWKFHRIWSQEWFYHREAEIQRAAVAYHAAVAAADHPEPDYDESGYLDLEQAVIEPPPDGRNGACPWATQRGSIDDYTLAELTDIILWIESDTLLRTEDELLAETIRTLGFQKRGSRIVPTITTAIRLARNGPAQPS